MMTPYQLTTVARFFISPPFETFHILKRKDLHHTRLGTTFTSNMPKYKETKQSEERLTSKKSVGEQHTKMKRSKPKAKTTAHSGSTVPADASEAGRSQDVGQAELYTFFYRNISPFSQHHPSEFTVDDVKYLNAEQYMMHQKAVLFGDDEIAKQILEESQPQVMKKLGRKVQGFDDKIWGENRITIVEKASYAKFSQNPDLKKAILATEGTVLVEASPRDTIWGIGLGANNPKALNKKTWRGRNLLGYTLTRVRDRLIKERSESSKDEVSHKSVDAE